MISANYLKSVNAEMPIPRAMSRMDELVTRSRWMKNGQEWVALLKGKCTLSLRELNLKSLGIKSLRVNKLGLMMMELSFFVSQTVMHTKRDMADTNRFISYQRFMGLLQAWQLKAS